MGSEAFLVPTCENVSDNELEAISAGLEPTNNIILFTSNMS